MGGYALTALAVSGLSPGLLPFVGLSILVPAVAGTLGYAGGHVIETTGTHLIKSGGAVGELVSDGVKKLYRSAEVPPGLLYDPSKKRTLGDGMRQHQDIVSGQAGISRRPMRDLTDLSTLQDHSYVAAHNFTDLNQSGPNIKL